MAVLNACKSYKKINIMYILHTLQILSNLMWALAIELQNNIGCL